MTPPSFEPPPLHLPPHICLLFIGLSELFKHSSYKSFVGYIFCKYLLSGFPLDFLNTAIRRAKVFILKSVYRFFLSWFDLCRN